VRISTVFLANSNSHYRAIDPLRAMERRGHEVLWPRNPEAPDVRQLAQCDVVHVYRRADDEIRPILRQLLRAGIAVTYDNDDDLTATPKQSPEYRKSGGLRGQRYFVATTKIARMAHTFTTPSEALGEKYLSAGAKQVEVIPNYLTPNVKRPRNRHAGVVIGWVAGLEHRADADRLRIAEALRRLIAKHDDVRVECIGVNLGLPERYRHDDLVPFLELPRRIGGFDIGIAPLADIPWNWARSDIKLKEYAASGIPWLASPIGPYRGLGEQQGGRLVPDDDWFDALDRLVARGRERRRLARKARAWAKSQTVESAASRWEKVFQEAAAARQYSPAA
jgi:glycosyltransferase involved in cell wall biosynthesis